MEEKAAQHENESNSPPKKNQLKSTLLASSEGRLLLAGIALALIYTFWLGIKLLLSPDKYQVLIGITATTIIFGRAAGLAFGYTIGMGHGRRHNDLHDN